MRKEERGRRKEERGKKKEDGPDVGGVALAGGDDALVLDDQIISIHHNLPREFSV